MKTACTLTDELVLLHEFMQLLYIGCGGFLAYAEIRGKSVLNKLTFHLRRWCSLEWLGKKVPMQKNTMPIRTALVTARNAPAHERVIRTLRAWDVRIDEAFFFGSIQKSEILKAFGANIFFDDQSVHTEPASKLVPAARVPYKEK